MSYASLEEALTVGVGIERSFLCPVHDDRNASASVNSLTGLWICYACGARGKADLDRIEIDPLHVQKMVRRALENLDDTRHTIYPESWLSLYDATGPGPYWAERFTYEACKRYRLGYNPDPFYYTIPMRDNLGSVLGVIKRHVTPGRKYSYPYGVDVTDYIFDWHRTSTPYLVLVEGATDAIAASEVGVQANALYGSRISRAQRMAILKYSPEVIYAAHDNDEAGEEAAEAVARAFEPYIRVKRLRWQLFKDLAEMPVDYRAEVLSRVAQHGKSGVVSPTCPSSTSTTRRFRLVTKPKTS